MPDEFSIPYDSEAEAGALGCMLLADNGEAERMLDQIDREDLHDIRHVEIFHALVRLQEDGRPLNTVELVQTLKDQGRLDQAGGFDLVSSLPEQTPSAANFTSFLETIKDRAARRRILAEACDMQARALDVSKPLDGRFELSSVAGQLREREFNPHIEPPPLRPIYTLAGIPICTPGNIATITSAIKTGKSAVIGAMAAAAMPHSSEADLLAFGSSNSKGMALLWFDSEQSPDDFWHCVFRAVIRAGLREPPPWLHAYCLTGMGCKRAWKALIEATRISRERHGGIHSMLLDGAADFVADVNDSGESNSFVAELHDIAIKHYCPIVGVIHFNPGSEKSRGHLGSQLERKAETNLALQKDDDETTVIYSTKNRRAGIPKDRGPRFRFDPEAEMHVTVESRQMVKDAAVREELFCLAQDVFKDHPVMRYSDLQTTVKRLLTVSDRTAERKVAQMRRLTVIKPSAVGLYVINTPA